MKWLIDDVHSKRQVKDMSLRQECQAMYNTIKHFTLASKLFSLAVQGSGALMSSNLEGALYKSP